MGLWDTVRAWFKTESGDLKQATDDLEQRIDADLSRRERQLNETPAQAMERIQAEMDNGDSSFSAISDKIEAAAARAAAAAEAEAGAGERPIEVDPEFLDRHQRPNRPTGPSDTAADTASDATADTPSEPAADSPAEPA